MDRMKRVAKLLVKVGNRKIIMGCINISALFLTLALIVSGCSSKGEKGKITITYATYAAPGYNEFRLREVKKFEKLHPGVSVKYEPIPGSYTAKLLTRIAGDTCPDIFFIPGSGEEFAKRGILLDLTSYVEKDKEYFEKIYPFLIEFVRYDGKIRALPGNLGVNCLYYNKKLFDEAGIPYPAEDWTWSDFLKTAKKLTREDTKGRIVQYGCVNIIPPLLIGSFGGSFWNEDKSKSIFASPQTIEAIQFHKDLSKKYRVAPWFLEHEKGQGNLQAFLTGRVAMFPGSSCHRAEFRFRKKGQLDWGLVPLPTAEDKIRRELLIYLRLGIYAKTKHPELVFKLLKFLIRPEGIRFLVEKGDSLPIRREGAAMDYFLNQYPEPRQEKVTLLRILTSSLSKSGYSFYGHPDIPLSLQAELMKQKIEEFYIGKGTAREVAEDIEKNLNQMLKEEK